MTLKALLPTIAFYVIAFFAVMLLERYSPSGPCTPGGGIMLLFLLIPVIIFLFLRSIYKAIFRNKDNWALVIIHAVLISIFVLFFRFDKYILIVK